jgi:hypothetical protein
LELLETIDPFDPATLDPVFPSPDPDAEPFVCFRNINRRFALELFEAFELNGTQAGTTLLSPATSNRFGAVGRPDPSGGPCFNAG